MPTRSAVAHGDEDSEKQLARWADRIEIALARALPDPLIEPVRLHAAMCYAVLGNGKRMRPALVYAAGCALGAGENTLDAPAVAVELVHAYSLVHDDLPAMDDDALRRGRATVHVAFDEATAILTGDALQALAFEVLADSALPAGLRVELIATLSRASGTSGMCGGQALDLANTGLSSEGLPSVGLAEIHRASAGSIPAGTITIDALERMHAQKTGALIRAAVRMGALCAQADAETLSRLDDYAAALGLAFQIRDDILDVEGNSVELGKTAGKDVAQSKSTYPSLLGMTESRRRLDDLGARMCESLLPFGTTASSLASLAARAVQRTR